MPKSWLVRGAETAERNRRRRQLQGVTPNGHPLWEPREIEPVTMMYPDYGSIFPRLERRTHPAVYSKAGRLGVTKPRPPTWSDGEKLRLRSVYPRGTKAEVEAAFPERTFSAVAKAANARRIYRESKPYKPSGNTLLDQILVRARDRNVSLTELDAETGCRGYFTRRTWRRTGFSFSAHVRAVAYLGGQMAIRWVDKPGEVQ